MRGAHAFLSNFYTTFKAFQFVFAFSISFAALVRLYPPPGTGRKHKLTRQKFVFAFFVMSAVTAATHQTQAERFPLSSYLSTIMTVTVAAVKADEKAPAV